MAAVSKFTDNINKKYNVVKKEFNHHEYTINGIQVHFPYELYDCQYNYILSVLTALKNKENALLESPTGTGKTLCLLCASISYLVDVLEKKGFYENINISEGNDNISVEFNKNKNMSSLGVPKIIYASRTHSQLKQVIKELENVYFIKNNEKYQILTTLLGSRDQLCIHEISTRYKGTLLNNTCKRIRRQGQCAYHSGVKMLDQLKHLFTTPMDVEKLNEMGKGNIVGQNIRFCPFYATREIQTDCQVIFLPYNYLFEESTRKILKLDLKNCIVIVDEGHNIESVAESSVSFKIKDSDLTMFLEAIKATVNIIDKVKDMDIDKDEKININEIFELNRSIIALLDWLNNEKLSKNPKNRIKEIHKSYIGKKIFDIFSSNNINMEKRNFEKLETLMFNMIELLNKYIVDIKLSQTDVNMIYKYIYAIDNIRKSFSILFSDIVSNCIEYFQLYLCEEEINFNESEDITKVYDNMKKYVKNKTKIVYNKNNVTTRKTMSLLCFSATASLCGILKEKVNSIIITSGTLSPIEPFSKQLSGKYFSFQNILENNHVIKSHQLFVACVPQYNKQNLLATYENRSNNDYINALGNCIYDIIILIPFGVLIFFASYSSMTETIQMWKKNQIYDKINQYKKIFVEPNKATELKSILDEYEYTIKQLKKGAIFIGVCRGKISEGIDFKDNSCRSVIICGLPYGNINDSKIIYKKEFLDNFHTDDNSNDSNTTRGNSWYNEEAMRSINQAIGRVIRHKDDYGSIFFLDSRFCSNNRIKDISKWVRTQFRIYRNMEQLQGDIEKFFELFKTVDNKKTTNEKQKIIKKPLEVGKNFQDCYIKKDKDNKTKNLHEKPNNVFIYKPIKKQKNVPKIFSMIKNITKNNVPQNIDNTGNKENFLFKLKEDNDNEKEPAEIETEEYNKRKAFTKLQDEIKEHFSENVLNSFEKYYKEMNDSEKEHKSEIFIVNVFKLLIKYYIDKKNKEENKENEEQNLIYDILNDIMNEKELLQMWIFLVKLINNLITENKEKCYRYIEKEFKEHTNKFDEMEKYFFNYRLNKIEMF